VILRFAEAVVAGEAESVTLTVKLEVPAVVGVPEIVFPESVSPAGKEPEVIVQLYGDVPAVACKVAEYAALTCPAGREVVVICTGLGAVATVNVSDSVAVFAVGVVESVTLTVNVKEPEVVGVPENVPAADRLIPAGNAP
jgi:hypothetical protein